MGPLLCAFALFPQGANPPDRSQAIVPVVEFQNADVREAVRWLFRKGLFGGTVAPEVQGVVTVSLRNVPWELALQQVLRQVEATYRIEHGFYEVVRREDEAFGPIVEPPAPWPSVADRQAIEAGYRWLRRNVALGRGKEIKAWLGDAVLESPIARTKVEGVQAYRAFVDTERAFPVFSLRGYRPVPRKAAGPAWIAAEVAYATTSDRAFVVYRDEWRPLSDGSWRLVHRQNATLRFENADIRDVLRMVWGDVGAAYRIDPRVQGRVTLDLTGVPFESALQQVLQNIRATYRIEGGVYDIVPQGE